ncbi:deoxyguanosinetriphosphate triphosphohydrolase [Defluviicoccus vanus]|uniref:Deoxyguanosinetriphosphate triphosphohydrolase-like protein n=1 Tax=Defluviicoccus vanus TaxID=111831 RepID=A0A7H1MZV7_9PROT|nr:deoxyguanosinetriphosphate triphosphohydrolase [Defluviicoccus vanus]QNT68993.1 deoxyguanosinetriphosphate triphosphohydrolase [Defluviicoccus vanus]
MTLAENLAPWASHAQASRGRLYSEPESKTRTCFQRDRDRIIHSAAFRRLEYKTQVFVNHEGDFFRTRLTHSLEVSQIARSVCRSLRLNEDLAEALALAHDLGHPPFGHAGEEALQEMMQPYDGFDHNAQSLRVITRLERRYADFDGLNLTWETLEGVVKHNGPLIGATLAGGKHAPLPAAIVDYSRDHDLMLDTHAGPEAQVAAMADDIAYNNHDIDDGLRAGLFTIADLAAVPLVGPVFAEVRAAYPRIDDSRLIHEAVRRIIGLMVGDLLAETGRRIAEVAPTSVADIRTAGAPVAGFSATMRDNDMALKAFLRQNMYRHYKLNRMTSKARRLVRDLFQLFVAEPECLPTDWRRRAGAPKSLQAARVVTDYIAGMTDRFAGDEYRRLFDVQTRAS